jgi:hypothetical protein
MTHTWSRVSRKQLRRESAIERIYNKYHGAPDLLHGGTKEARAGITLANTLQNQQNDAQKAGRRTKKDHSSRANLRRKA